MTGPAPGARPGHIEVATGTCYLTETLENSRWRLCWSNFQGTLSYPQ